MTDSPFIDNEDMPHPHNPVMMLPRIDKMAESDVFRFDDGHAQRLAEWCSGTVSVEGAGLVVETGGSPSATARVGDYVIRTYGDDGPPWYVTMSEPDYRVAWWPKGYVPDWQWRCYQPWEPQPDPSPPTTPDLGPDDFPHVHHPVRYLPWLDNLTRVEVFQHRAGLSQRLAEWCGGTVSFTDRLVVLVPDAEDPNVLNPAGLGDFVTRDSFGAFRVESSDGFNQRFWPVGRDPGWSHRCFMNWEGPR